MISHLNEWLSTSPITFQSVELSKAFLTFLMFSFIGWICEVLYVGIFYEHKFINRGFLYGPLCPIYGFGGIVILALPKQLQNPVWVLFLSGIFFCSVVEYIGSWLLEKMFHAHWWDYSNMKITIKGKTIPLNIKGRVCLLNSVLFGIMTVGVIDFVQPLINRFFALFDDVYLNLANDIFAVALLIDLTFTIHKLVDFTVYNERIKDFIENAKEKFHSETWFKDTSMAEQLASIKNRMETHRENFNDSFSKKWDEFLVHQKNAERWIKKFPSITSIKYRESIVHLKQKIKSYKHRNDSKN